MFPFALLSGGFDTYVSTPAMVTVLPRASPSWMVPLRQQSPDGFARTGAFGRFLDLGGVLHPEAGIACFVRWKV
jgi:hypothetical protein